MKPEIVPELNAQDKTMMENILAAGKILHKFAVCLLTLLNRSNGKGTYGLQADKKTLSVTVPHKDRGAPFECINRECKKAEAKGVPVLSIDAKKKEKRGNVTNNGRTYQPAKTPIETLDHDFPLVE
jgi:hypothetical protein